MSTPVETFDVAPFDEFVQRITNGVALTGGVLMLPALFWYLSGIGQVIGFIFGILVSSGVAAALAVWLLLSYAATPVRYEIEPTQFTVRRRWLRALRVPLRDVTGVALAGAPDLPRRGVRRALNIGVFGYHGRFALEPFGQVYFAATNREQMVTVARLDAPPLLVSPARPRALTDALREAVSGRAVESTGERGSGGAGERGSGGAGDL